MPLNDILNCDADKLWSILDSEEQDDPRQWFFAKRIGAIELSALGEMLDVDSYDNLMGGFQLVGEPRDNGPWPQTLPVKLIARVAMLSDAEIAGVVPRWSQVEELEGSTSDALTTYLSGLRDFLSRRSGDFFLVSAL